MPAHMQFESFTPSMVASRSVTVAPGATHTLLLTPSVPVTTVPLVATAWIVESVERSPSQGGAIMRVVPIVTSVSSGATVTEPLEALAPAPIPDAPSPPLAMIAPPLMQMAPQSMPEPPPMPAPRPLLLAVSEPEPPMSSLLPEGT